MPRPAERQLVVALNHDARRFNEVYRNWLGHGGYFACNNLFNRLAALRIIAYELPRVPLMQPPIHVACRTDRAGWSWDDGVRGSLPFWSFERVRALTPTPGQMR